MTENPTLASALAIQSVGRPCRSSSDDQRLQLPCGASEGSAQHKAIMGTRLCQLAQFARVPVAEEDLGTLMALVSGS